MPPLDIALYCRVETCTGSNYGALFLPYTSNEPPLPDLTLPATPAPSRNPSFTQQDGLLEVQAIAPPDDQKRSWFVDEQVVSGAFDLSSFRCLI